MTVRHLTLLTGDGDLEIVWEEHEDEFMREMIAKKMKEGVRFFIRKPILGTVFTTKKEVKRVSAIKDNHITVSDPDVRKLFSEGKIALQRAAPGEYDTTTVAKTPEEVIANPSVGVKAFSGG